MPSITIAERALDLGADLTIGIWCADDPNYDPPHYLSERIPFSRDYAEALGRPLIVYFDRATGVDPAIVPLLTADDHVALQCYRNQGETNDAFRTRLLQNIALCPVKTIWLVIGAHTRQFLSDQEIIDGIRICAETLRDDPDILGGMPFREGTSDGPQDHPAVAEALDAVFVTITGIPDLPVFVPPVDPPDPPDPEPPDPEPPDPPDPPDPPTPEVPVPTAIALDPVKHASVVTERPHPDGQGWVALERGDGQFLSVDDGTGEVRWARSAGAWERFYPGSSYTAVRSCGTFLFARGGTWT